MRHVNVRVVPVPLTRWKGKAELYDGERIIGVQPEARPRVADVVYLVVVSEPT